MTDREALKPGSFYWVVPNWDVDLIPPGFENKEYSDEMFEASRAHWSQNEQPALFNGLDGDGNEMWSFIGQDDPEPSEHWWSVRWVGDQIVRRAA